MWWRCVENILLSLTVVLITGLSAVMWPWLALTSDGWAGVASVTSLQRSQHVVHCACLSSCQWPTVAQRERPASSGVLEWGLCGAEAQPTTWTWSRGETCPCCCDHWGLGVMCHHNITQPFMTDTEDNWVVPIKSLDAYKVWPSKSTS